MSLLATVSSGVKPQPHYILVHGMPGLGKTTFASQAPNPIFLCAEKGTRHLDVKRLELTSFEQFMAAIDELKTAAHDYKTVVIDTVDHLEPLIHRVVCADKNKESIEDIGFAKGYIYALDYWRQLTTGLEALRDERGMNIVLLAHTDIKAHNDPQLAEPFDRYQVKLHKKAADILIDRAENVLFINSVTHVDSTNGRAKGYGDGTRVLFTENRPAYQAKSRFSLPLKIPIDAENGWQKFANACLAQQSRTIADIRANAAELLKEVDNKDLRKKIEAKLAETGDDQKMLIAIENRIKEIVSK